MAKNMRNLRGFTLAEVMIVLTVIGVLTAILLPVARQSMPNEDLMKFKKAHNTLGTVIRELVTNDKYYLDGDLGVKPDNNLVNSATYFCETIADVLNTKSVDCSDVDEGKDHMHLHLAIIGGVDNTQSEKEKADALCKLYPKSEIITSDNITLYSVSPHHHFAIHYQDEYPDVRLFGNPGQWGDKFEADEDGNPTGLGENVNNFDVIYKVFCIDIDEINQGEDPFGYGIRADGKILTGARAEEWLKKEVNEE